MTSLPVCAITDTGHQPLTFEPSPDSIVDTLWLSPVWLHTQQSERAEEREEEREEEEREEREEGDKNSTCKRYCSILETCVISI